MPHISRRRFVQAVSAAGAALALPQAASNAAAAPHRVRVESHNGAVTASVINDPAGGTLEIPCTMPMASGAPLTRTAPDTVKKPCRPTPGRAINYLPMKTILGKNLCWL